jgi:hypothetical protein
MTMQYLGSVSKETKGALALGNESFIQPNTHQAV